MLLSRRTEDRSRDISEELREQVLDGLRELKASASWLTMVEQFDGRSTALDLPPSLTFPLEPLSPKPQNGSTEIPWGQNYRQSVSHC